MKNLYGLNEFEIRRKLNDVKKGYVPVEDINLDIDKTFNKKDIDIRFNFIKSYAKDFGKYGRVVRCILDEERIARCYILSYETLDLLLMIRENENNNGK